MYLVLRAHTESEITESREKREKDKQWKTELGLVDTMVAASNVFGLSGSMTSAKVMRLENADHSR